MPCFWKKRWLCFATSPSIPGRMRSRNSTTVTSEPRRRQTEPISRPMMPAPTTSSRFGTLFSSSAPVEVTTRCSSIATPGSGVEFGAGGDDDGLGLERLLAAVLRRHLHLAGRERCARAP